MVVISLRWRVLLRLLSVSVAFVLSGTVPAAAVSLAAAAGAAVVSGPGLDGPEPKSQSLVLMDAASGQVLYAKNPDERRHPASVTKVMTLSVAYDALQAGQISWDDEAETSLAAQKLGGTTVFLEAGERVTVRNLMRAIAIASANDASLVLAEHIAGSEAAFADLMNEKAARLGMVNTHFVNPHGLDHDNHYTTAYDLALLARHVALHQPELLEFTKVFHDYFEHNNGRRTDMANFNRLVTLYDGADGLKTGFTAKAGYTLAATAQRGGTRLIATVMGAPTPADRQSEAMRLLDYGFAHFVSVPVADAGTVLAEVQVLRGLHDRVAAVLPEAVALTQRRGQELPVEQSVELTAVRVPAPVQQGDVLGYLVVTAGDEERRIPVVAAADVPRAGAIRLFWRYLTGAFW